MVFEVVNFIKDFTIIFGWGAAYKSHRSYLLTNALAFTILQLIWVLEFLKNCSISVNFIDAESTTRQKNKHSLQRHAIGNMHNFLCSWRWVNSWDRFTTLTWVLNHCWIIFEQCEDCEWLILSDIILIIKAFTDFPMKNENQNIYAISDLELVKDRAKWWSSPILIASW